MQLGDANLKFAVVCNFTRQSLLSCDCFCWRYFIHVHSLTIDSGIASLTVK